MDLDPKVLSDLIEINMAEIKPLFENGEASPKPAYTALANAIVQFLPVEITDPITDEDFRAYQSDVEAKFTDIRQRLDDISTGGGGSGDSSELQDKVYSLNTLINELNVRLNTVENKEDIRTYIQATKEGEGR